MSHQRNAAWKWLGAGVTALVLSLSTATTAQANPQVYQKAAGATAYIKLPNGRYTTTFLVDDKAKLMVAAHHALKGNNGLPEAVDVVFAQKDKGAYVTDLAWYQDRHQQLAIRAKVVYQDASRDLVLLQLDKLPDAVTALPLAAGDPELGEEIHVVGNAMFKVGGLFGYLTGKVRHVQPWTHQAVNARVVSNQAPANPGDEGGPVLNNRGEVVAFVSYGTSGAIAPQHSPFYAQQLVQMSISVSELRHGLQEYQAKVAAR